MPATNNTTPTSRPCAVVLKFIATVIILVVFIIVDAISENNPRVIDDARARKLAGDLRRCVYYETCATYGLNIERVFQDGQ